MKFTNEGLTIEICDRCTHPEDGKVGNVAKYECVFCRKHICENCSTGLDWSSGTGVKFCRVCKEFIEKTTGNDLKRLGFDCKYESITDETSIKSAIESIAKKYRELGDKAISKFLNALYNEAQNRKVVKQKQDKILEKIQTAKQKLLQLEKEKEVAVKEIYLNNEDNLPF